MAVKGIFGLVYLAPYASMRGHKGEGAVAVWLAVVLGPLSLIVLIPWAIYLDARLWPSRAIRARPSVPNDLATHDPVRDVQRGSEDTRQPWVHPTQDSSRQRRTGSGCPWRAGPLDTMNPSWCALADLGTAPALGVRAVLYYGEGCGPLLCPSCRGGDSSGQFGLDSLVPQAHGQDMQSSSRLASPHPTPTKSPIECRTTRSTTWPGSLFGCAATSRRRRPTVRPGRRPSNGATTSSRRFDLSEWIQTLSLGRRCLRDRVRAEPIPV